MILPEGGHRVILTLARPTGAPEGTTPRLGLSVVPLRRGDGSRNGVVIKRLRHKLGTKMVPTAESQHDRRRVRAADPTLLRAGRAG